MIQQSNQKSNINIKEDNFDEVETFQEMKLDHNLIRGIYGKGFDKPSRIQCQSVMPIISGRDVIAQAQAGTGKTAAYAIGSLQRVDQESMHTQIIVLTPTRELSLSQSIIFKQICEYTKIRVQAAVGGTDTRKNIKDIKQNNPHVIIGTPGRCQNFIERGIIKTDALKCVILDQADEMLDRNFVDQIKEIFGNIPPDTQICLFSATLPKDVLEITDKFMKNPYKILVKLQDVKVQTIKQFSVCMNQDSQKFPTLIHLFKNIKIQQVIIFTNTIERVNQLTQKLTEMQFPVTCIHSQVQHRYESLQEFRRGDKRIMIASDLIGRGIDIPSVTLVINYDLPTSSNALEQYIHRIGRCGRYGKRGTSINFVTEGDADILVRIQKHYNFDIPDLPLDLEKVFD